MAEFVQLPTSVTAVALNTLEISVKCVSVLSCSTELNCLLCNKYTYHSLYDIHCYEKLY